MSLTGTFEGSVFIAKTKSGYEYRLVYSNNNEQVDDYIEFYDENYIRYLYKYYSDKPYVGQLACCEYETYEWENVCLEAEQPNILVDCTENLLVLNKDTGDYKEWADDHQDEIKDMTDDTFYRYRDSYVEVKSLNRVKTTGNYRVKMDVYGLVYPYKHRWMVLMNEDGKILKKALADTD